MVDAEHNDLPAGRQLPADRVIDGGHALAAGYDQLGASPASAEALGGGLDFDLREYWRILNKRKKLIGSIIAAFLLIGLLWTMLATPLYTSTVRLQIDRNAAKVVEGGHVSPVEQSGDTEFLKTQYELLQSRNLAERVVSITRLASDPEYSSPSGGSFLSFFRSSKQADESKQQSNKERAAAATVLGYRVVRPLPGSRLFDISYSDVKPERAQKIAAAFGEAFIAFNLDKRFAANSYAKTFLDDQLKQLKLRLEESEKTMLEFAEKQQIVATTDKTSIAESNLAGANSALGVIISERIKNEQLWKQVESATGISLPQILSNKVVEDLRGRRNLLVTEYEEKSETFRPSYPTMVQLSNKIKEVDRQLTAEVHAIKSSLKAAYESSLSQENQMKERIEGLRTDVLDLQKRSIQYNILKREVDTTRSLYEGLLQRFKEVDIAGGVGSNNVFVIDRPELPRKPSSPVMLKSLAIASVLGIVTGLLTAYVIERADDIIHSPDEAERITGLGTLGVIPKVQPPRTIEEELVNPRSGVGEAYRSLCTTLQFSTERGLPRTLLITSAGASEGKSTTSVAIVRHFAVTGLRVLLIDADLRKGLLHKRLGLDNSVGLSNYLTGNCNPAEAIQRTEQENFYFMAAGPMPPNAADLLVSSRLSTMLSVGLDVFDLIVVDAPPVMGLADVPLLTRATEATVFVAAAGQSRIGFIRNALKRLRMTRVYLIGTVITKFDAKTASYGYGYGYGYGYSFEYGHVENDAAEAKLEDASAKDSKPQQDSDADASENVT